MHPPAAFFGCRNSGTLIRSEVFRVPPQNGVPAHRALADRPADYVRNIARNIDPIRFRTRRFYQVAQNRMLQPVTGNRPSMAGSGFLRAILVCFGDAFLPAVLFRPSFLPERRPHCPARPHRHLRSEQDDYHPPDNQQGIPHGIRHRVTQGGRLALDSVFNSSQRSRGGTRAGGTPQRKGRMEFE